MKRFEDSAPPLPNTPGPAAADPPPKAGEAVEAPNNPGVGVEVAVELPNNPNICLLFINDLCAMGYFI